MKICHYCKTEYKGLICPACFHKKALKKTQTKPKKDYVEVITFPKYRLDLGFKK